MGRALKLFMDFDSAMKNVLEDINTDEENLIRSERKARELGIQVKSKDGSIKSFKEIFKDLSL